MLSRRVCYSFSFNILNAFRGIGEVIRAPMRHFKSNFQPSGANHSTQTNVTAEGFDEVSAEWQAHIGGNPFDLHTYNYFESTQLSNFGTIDNPLVVFTADAPFRFVGCSGPQNEDDYESHELMWMMLREGPLQRCMICGQVFKLVRLRNEFSSEMDYYMPNFNQLWFQDMGESQITNNISLFKANTHFQHSVFETPENTSYSFVSSDQHDRILTDPAYRMQRKAEAHLKNKIYLLAMEDYEREKMLNDPFKEPLDKNTYENLIEAEAVIKKLDRQFRKLTKFHARKYVDPVNHSRREKRMIQKSNKRWDNSYTLFSENLTEEELRYKDYFETDLQTYREDERVEEFLDKQELLSDARYNLGRFDFVEGYTHNPEDDQTSYIEKKIFKFKYRRALDTQANYQRRNQRMIEGQKVRFQHNNAIQVIQNYLKDPTANQAQYLKLLEDQSVAQYRDYFKSQDDQFDNLLLSVSKKQFINTFENWQIQKRDRSTHKTFPLPKWNDELGLWANAIQIVREVQQVDNKLNEIQYNHSIASLSTSAIEKKN